jgi:peptide/nickel transport system permease protein
VAFTAVLPPGQSRRFPLLGRWVLMRVLLLPAQIGFFLTILFTADFVQTASLTSCQACLFPEYGDGYVRFVIDLLSGNWGDATFGRLIAPATQFISWWLPGSIELAAFALVLSVSLAYLAGIYAGWFGGRPVDIGVRTASISMLFLPTFLVVLLVLGVAYGAFYRTVGDAPFGITPTVNWWSFHGGTPAWICIAGNTEPTGFPLLDGAVHGAWSFEIVTLAKTLLQAATIALVFTPIFLRYLRGALLELPHQPFIEAARARGVPERTLMWTHGARYVWPYFLLSLGAALPVYIGTQILTELVYNDAGLGTIFMLYLTSRQLAGFPTILVLLLAVVLLVAGICTGALARHSDRRRLEARS